MKITRIVLSVLIAVPIAAFFDFDLHHFLTFDSLETRQAAIEQYRQTHPASAVAMYSAFISLSLPSVAVLTLAGGGIFGVFWSSIIVTFASTIGATPAFVAVRFLLRDGSKPSSVTVHRLWKRVWSETARVILFSLRPVPVFPFLQINLAKGLTPMKALTFFRVNQACMQTGTVVYVNAGKQLCQSDSLSGILLPALLRWFALLGFFPLLTKKCSISSKNVKSMPAGRDPNASTTIWW